MGADEWGHVLRKPHTILKPNSVNDLECGSAIGAHSLEIAIHHFLFKEPK